MCAKCIELDAKIDHYREPGQDDYRPGHPSDGIAKAIEKANAEKAALHPEQEL
jgi:hypothetical protein